MNMFLSVHFHKVHVNKGMMDGERITFRGEGDQQVSLLQFWENPFLTYVKPCFSTPVSYVEPEKPVFYAVSGFSTSVSYVEPENLFFTSCKVFQNPFLYSWISLYK